MKTYVLEEKAEKIRNDAAQFEQRLKKVVDLSKKLGIQLTPDIIHQLTQSAPGGITQLINAKQDATNDAYALANLSKKPTKQLDDANLLLDGLRDEVRKLAIAKPLPERVWKGAKIDEQALGALIVLQCVVELSPQQKEDIKLIEQVAKALPRFNPLDFIYEGRINYEAFLDF